SAHYTPTNPCSPFPDTLTATANTICGVVLAARRASTTCNNTPPSPRLVMTKSCPATNGIPGGVIGFTGTITNTRNIHITNIVIVSITNIVIVNNQPTNNSPVIIIARLDPGQGTNFSGTEPVGTNVCSITDILSASGRDVCNNPVTASATNTCPVQTSPRLAMTKLCPTTNGVPGGVIGFTGTITNTGNVSITNIVIVNNQPTNNTPVITIPRLDPGQGQTFSGTEAVGTNVCSITDVLSASGRDVCGNPVTGSATNTCTVQTTPRLAVTKSCPATNVVPGGVLGFTGTVTNIGNVAVTNVVVVNSQPVSNTQVITIPRLEPGEGRSFSGSYVVPSITCSSGACTISDTLTVTA